MKMLGFFLFKVPSTGGTGDIVGGSGFLGKVYPTISHMIRVVHPGKFNIAPKNRNIPKGNSSSK